MRERLAVLIKELFIELMGVVGTNHSDHLFPHYLHNDGLLSIKGRLFLLQVDDGLGDGRRVLFTRAGRVCVSLVVIGGIVAIAVVVVILLMLLRIVLALVFVVLIVPRVLTVLVGVVMMVVAGIGLVLVVIVVGGGGGRGGGGGSHNRGGFVFSRQVVTAIFEELHDTRMQFRVVLIYRVRPFQTLKVNKQKNN